MVICLKYISQSLTSTFVFVNTFKTKLNTFKFTQYQYLAQKFKKGGKNNIIKKMLRENNIFSLKCLSNMFISFFLRSDNCLSMH